MKLIIDRQKVYARHGVLTQEQDVGAYYYISIDAFIPNPPAVETDQINDTVSYADVAQVVNREMETPSRLLEHAAGRIARKLLNLFPEIQHVKVKIIKENPPMGIECQGAGIELEMGNE